MKAKHLDLAELWSCLSGEGAGDEALRHWNDCPLCRQEGLRWQAVFREQGQRAGKTVDGLPEVFWQKFETKIRSEIRDSAASGGLFLWRPFLALAGTVIMACLVGWYGNQWNPVLPDQVELAANFIADFAEDSTEDQLWTDIDRLLGQSPGGELGELFFEEDQP